MFRDSDESYQIAVRGITTRFPDQSRFCLVNLNYSENHKSDMEDWKESEDSRDREERGEHTEKPDQLDHVSQPERIKCHEEFEDPEELALQWHKGTLGTTYSASAKSAK